MFRKNDDTLMIQFRYNLNTVNCCMNMCSDVQLNQKKEQNVFCVYAYDKHQLTKDYISKMYVYYI